MVGVDGHLERPDRLGQRAQRPSQGLHLPHRLGNEGDVDVAGLLQVAHRAGQRRRQGLRRGQPLHAHRRAVPLEGRGQQRRLPAPGQQLQDAVGKRDDLVSAAVALAHLGVGVGQAGQRLFGVVPTLQAAIGVDTLGGIAQQGEGAIARQLPQHRQVQRRRVLRLVHHHMVVERRRHPVDVRVQVRQRRQISDVDRLGRLGRVLNEQLNLIFRQNAFAQTAEPRGVGQQVAIGRQRVEHGPQLVQVGGERLLHHGARGGAARGALPFVLPAGGAQPGALGLALAVSGQRAQRRGAVGEGCRRLGLFQVQVVGLLRIAGVAIQTHGLRQQPRVTLGQLLGLVFQFPQALLISGGVGAHQLTQHQFLKALAVAQQGQRGQGLVDGLQPRLGQSGRHPQRAKALVGEALGRQPDLAAPPLGQALHEAPHAQRDLELPAPHQGPLRRGREAPAEQGRERGVGHGPAGEAQAVERPIVEGGLGDFGDAQAGEHVGDVAQEHLVGAKDDAALGLEVEAVAGIEQEGHAVQGHGRLAAAGHALDDQHLGRVGADEVVLVFLDGGDDVLHLDVAPAGEDVAQVGVGVHQGGPGLVAGGRVGAGIVLVVQAQQPLFGHLKVALELELHRGRAVGAEVAHPAGAPAREQPRQGRAPIDHHDLAAALDPDAAEVVSLAVGHPGRAQVQPAEVHLPGGQAQGLVDAHQVTMEHGRIVRRRAGGLVITHLVAALFQNGQRGAQVLGFQGALGMVGGGHGALVSAV